LSVLALQRGVFTAQSGRERDGLRNLVKTCIQGEMAREYDRDGKILELRCTDPDGFQWGTTSIYDADERLVKTVSIQRAYGPEGFVQKGPLSGTTIVETYSYDEAGRLLCISDSGGDRTDFRHDDVGRKTKVVTIAPHPNDSGGISEASCAMEVAERGIAVRRRGGSVTTLYNERCQPTEVQVRDSVGTLLQRIVSDYDTDGLLVKKEMIVESFGETVLPKEFADKIPEKDHAAAVAELKQAMEALQRSHFGRHQRTYSYKRRR
jgi:YD repeat-containing protein